MSLSHASMCFHQNWTTFLVPTQVLDGPVYFAVAMHVQVLCTDVFMHALTLSKFGHIKLRSALICRERQK